MLHRIVGPKQILLARHIPGEISIFYLTRPLIKCYIYMKWYYELYFIVRVLYQLILLFNMWHIRLVCKKNIKPSVQYDSYAQYLIYKWSYIERFIQHNVVFHYYSLYISLIISSITHIASCFIDQRHVGSSFFPPHNLLTMSTRQRIYYLVQLAE